MLKIDFTKIVASGNDFVVIASFRSPVIPLKRLAQKLCDRKYGAGADGMLFLEKSQIADVKMRIFNPDGSEAEMCGNGARCVALWAKSTVPARGGSAFGGNSQQSPPEAGPPSAETVKIETKAGIIESRVNGENVRIKLTEPKDLKLNLPIKVNNRTLRVNFINTGVPHTVIFVEDLPRPFFTANKQNIKKGRGLDKIDVINLGRQIRFHKRFAPQGTNVDFVEALTNKSIKIRTYERGVENETSACGTGIVSSSLIAYRLSLIAKIPVDVLTQSGEILKVYFKKTNNKFKNVWLEGKARIVYKGVYYV